MPSPIRTAVADPGIDYPPAGETWWKVSGLVRRETYVKAKGWFAARAAGAAKLDAHVENCKVTPHNGPPLEVPTVPTEARVVDEQEKPVAFEKSCGRRA